MQTANVAAFNKIFSTHVEMNRSADWVDRMTMNFLYARGDEPVQTPENVASMDIFSTHVEMNR